MTLILSGTDGLSDIDGSAATPAIRGTDANTGIFFPAADTIAFAEGGVEAMRIDSSGNVGIGTSSPASKLEVAGYTNITTGGIKVSGSVTGYTNEVSLGGTTADSSYAISTTGTGTPNMFFDHRGTSNTGTFTFRVGTGGGTERMRIDSSGNVGIGTSSPSYKLDVSGNGRVTGDLYVGASTNIIYESSSNLNVRAANALVLSTNGANERMRIDSSGNVMMGVTSPLSSGKFSISFDGSTRQGQVLRTTIGTTGSTYIQFENSAGSTAGYIIHNGTTTVNYVTSSDYRLKEEITPMTGALAKVAQLKPVTYKWKVDGSDGEGFIAHELAEVCPIAVTRKKDEVDADGNPKYQGVDTSFLVATLTAAIQEQQALITALTARITALEAQNANNPSQGETP